MPGQSLKVIKQLLENQGLKATHQRMVIYKALNESHEHPTAEKIFDRIKKSNPSISLATVYKTLEVFVDRSLVRRVNSPEGYMRYDGVTDDHNHIFCTNTQEIIDFKDEELSQLIHDFFRKKKIINFDMKDIKLHITGKKIDPDKGVEIKQI